MNPIEDEKMPEIFCEIVVYFHNNDLNFAKEQLLALPIGPMECKQDPLIKDYSYVSFARLYYKTFWDIDDALTEMFAKIDPYLPQICEIAEQFHGRFIIDIALCVYGAFPALMFSGENMRKIHSMKADISIDPYYYGNVSNETEEKAETAP